MLKTQAAKAAFSVYEISNGIRILKMVGPKENCQAYVDKHACHTVKYVIEGWPVWLTVAGRR